MLRHLAGAFDKATAFVACVLVAALLVCVSLGVVTRAVGAPLIWTDEFSRFLMVWLAVFGGILASRKRLHVRIRYFQDLLPARAHRAVELAIQFAVTLFGALICVLQRRPREQEPGPRGDVAAYLHVVDVRADGAGGRGIRSAGGARDAGSPAPS